ncbi:MAG: hypothetical protein JW797_16760 [Bradymonadales bacterium]|nr:hypothetical protein [Bradymonadales bacterium]
MLVILACNCLRLMEIQTGYEFMQTDKHMTGLKVQRVQQGTQAYGQRTELTSAQEELLWVMKLPVLPKSWSLDRHKTEG